MKFFSNEKDTEVEPQADPDRTQPVATGPVPSQRAGSPWSDAPASTDSSRPADGSAPVFEPEDGSRPSPSPRDDASRVDETSRTDDGAPADSADKTVSSTTYGPDGTVVEDTDHRGARTDAPRDDSPVDLPLTDDDTSPSSSSSASSSSSSSSPEQAAIKDDGTFDSPKAVDPATGDKLDDDRSSDSQPSADRPSADRLDGSDRPSADRLDGSDRLDSEDFQRASDTPPASPVAETAAVPVAAAPKPTAGSTTGDKLLPDGDSFAERFRDIQLRFVDEPKEATAEAATLVGDAVDKLTSALKAQRDGLAGNSDDTEKLRVELRAYREILNRLLAL